MIPRTLLNLFRLYKRNRWTMETQPDWTEYHRLMGQARMEWCRNNPHLDRWDMPNFNIDVPEKQERVERDINDLLRAHPAIRVLGTGHFSTVIKIDGIVIKVVRNLDQSYEAFAQFCQNYYSPFLPEIIGPFDIRGFKVYVMEELQANDDRAYNDAKICRAILRGGSADLLIPELASVLVALRAFQDSNDNLSEDLHSANVLYRGSQLVINDPWS